MKFGIVIFPGSNCDQDCLWALRDVMKQTVHYIWHQETNLKGFDCIVLPGGFSYGDHLRAGAIARFSPVMKELCRFAASGGLVLGICNGFQILLEAGLLPGAMLSNKNLNFICRDVFLKVENNSTAFTRCCPRDQALKIPIAHHEGNYYTTDSELKRLEDNGQIVFRYSDAEGNVSEEANPNGAVGNIAGIINQQGNVLGMMPHPERVSDKILGSGSDDGLFILNSITNG